jgi:hypothetical protein
MICKLSSGKYRLYSRSNIYITDKNRGIFIRRYTRPGAAQANAK